MYDNALIVLYIVFFSVLAGGCSSWLCYDSFSTQTSPYSNNSSCGDENYVYTSRDVIFSSTISSLGGLAVGVAATWMLLFARYSARKIYNEVEGRSLSTVQSPIGGGGGEGEGVVGEKSSLE